MVKKIKKQSILSYFSMILGLIIIIFSFFMWQNNSEKYNNFDKKGRATLIKYIKLENKNIPVYKYLINKKEYQLIDSNVGLVDRTKKEADIKYSSKNPTNSAIYDSYSTWGIPLSIAIIGFFILFFGFIIYRIGF